MEFSYAASENVNRYNASEKLNKLPEMIIGISYNPAIPFFSVKST